MDFDNALAKVADLLQDESVKLLIEQGLDENGVEVNMVKELISVKYFLPNRKSFDAYKNVFESNTSKSPAAIIYQNKKAEIKSLLTQSFISQLKNSLKPLKT